MKFQNLQFELSNKTALLTINRARVLNVLNWATLNDLESFAKNIVKNKDCQALIITGAGEKSFVAGADISEMINFNREQAEAFSEKGQRVLSLMESLPFPVLSAVNGFALGGGMELALACDIILMSERAKIGLPEVSLALIPGFGGLQRLKQAVGVHKAKEMIYSGNIYSARKAFEMGFGNQVVAHSELMAKAFALMDNIKQNSLKAIAKAKMLMRAEEDMSAEEDTLVLEKRSQKTAKEFSKLFDSPSAKETMRSFLDKKLKLSARSTN